MSLIRDMRKQFAVWWKRSDFPDEFGKYSYEAPVEIRCRWVDIIGEFRNAKAEALNSKAVVYVDREMKVGDYLKKGEMDTGTTVEDPTDDQVAYPIIGWEDTPDIQNREHLLAAHL